MVIGVKEHGTFSALIDQAVKLSGRGIAARDALCSYVRSSARECQVLALFERDITEDTLTATASPFNWPRPRFFRTFRTVRYAGAIYPKYILPGRRQKSEDNFYYGGPNYFAFAGVEANATFDVAYYSNFAPLVYFEAAQRPARFFADTNQWQYLDANGVYQDTLGTTDLDEAAEKLVSNWMLFDWYDMVLEGALAKQYKSTGDQRSITHFSLFKSFQDDLLMNEVTASVDR